jgi:hypothetical protein
MSSLSAIDGARDAADVIKLLVKWADEQSKKGLVAHCPGARTLGTSCFTFTAPAGQDHPRALGADGASRAGASVKAGAHRARNDGSAASRATNRPDGQITKSLSSPCCKNIPLNMSRKSPA